MRTGDPINIYNSIGGGLERNGHVVMHEGEQKVR